MPQLSLSEADALCRRALVAARTSPENAAHVAAALVLAEADGQRGHGLSRVPSYCAQSRSGKVDGFATPRLATVRPGLMRVDAGLGFAYPAIALAFDPLVAMTRTQGIAAAVLHGSHHFGVGGHHCEALAEAGLVAFIYGNSPKAMAPWGGKSPLLGTNPVAFAAPLPDGAPLVIDLATSQVARGKILAARENGEDTIPEGWAFGPDGNPTTQTDTALAGTMAPMGGAKGAAVALMVEVMAAALTGSAFAFEASSLMNGDGPSPNLGQTIIAMDADAGSDGAFGARMAALVGAFAAEDGVRFPGTGRLAARAAAKTEGVTISAALLDQINSIADEDATQA